MLATSPSPTLRPESHYEPARAYSPKQQYDIRPQPHQARSALISHPKHYPFPSPVHPPERSSSVRSLGSASPRPKPRPRMVDAATQYSPPKSATSPDSSTKTPITDIAGLKIDGRSAAINQEGDKPHPRPSVPDSSIGKPNNQVSASAPQQQIKRHASEDLSEASTKSSTEAYQRKKVMDDSSSKKSRPDAPAAQVVPHDYEHCDNRDLVILISSMLMELIRYNDAIPLKDGHLTRFHSRAPPGISVQDYLQRLTTHATLPPPILLSMVYYIDRLCALYPAFTITSLTVHRFLIASATVASKGLSDSFWTNKTYARVGGVSVKELALLELEFLTRLEWKIVPKNEVLSDYYRSLVKRSETHVLDSEGVT